MKRQNIATNCALALLLTTITAVGDTNLILTASHDGTLTWTNVDPALYYSVEWRPSLTGPNGWTGSYRSAQDVHSTNAIVTVPVPVFYRVVGTTNPAHTKTLAPGSVLVTEGYYAETNLTLVDPDLNSANLRAGATIFGVAGSANVVNTASGDAQAGELLSGKKAWVDGAEVTGTMPNRGAAVITPGTAQQSIQAGYHNGAGYVQGDADLISGNVRAGTSIFGVTGNSQVVNTSSGDAQAGEVLTGKKAWVDGAEVTGSMPNRGTVVITPGTNQQTIPAGYHNGAGYVPGDADLVASNIVVGAEVFGVVGLHGQYHADGFPAVTKSLWETFDPGANGVGTDPDGYDGAVFDGRYLYFVPIQNGSSYHGEVLRLDTQGDFKSTNAWAAFDPGAHGIGTNPVGYIGGVFDGRYVYFAPYSNGTPHGEVLRLDTHGDFNSTNAWATYTPHAHGVGAHVGYYGAVFDGRHVYFCPNADGGGRHGEFLRYDTQSPFGETNSWTAFDPGSQGVGTDPDGYFGGAFDGRFIYFTPGNNGSIWHSEVLRYDTQSAFNATNSWRTFDPTANGVSSSRGYVGSVFDGRYVYLVPYYNGASFFGQVVRYDTQGDFSVPSAWAAFDPGTAGVGSDPDGFIGGVFDGHYVYFVPYNNGSASSGEILRYDVREEFQAADSWTTYDPASNGIGTARGFAGGAFDGRHVYFVPYHNGTSYHGEVLRYDAKNPPGIPAIVSGGSFF